jgi:hippurate hydrolase
MTTEPAATNGATDTGPGPGAVEAVLADLDRVRSWQEDLYRDLHQHPELSHQEHRTAAAGAARLRQDGYDVTEGVGGTGVVGILRNGGGSTVLLRADMDALPVREATGLSYASTATAIDAHGTTVPVMHACGHDVHVTCALGAASLLAAHRDQWAGTVAIVLQPAEELGDGARRMVEDSLSALLGTVDVAFAQHVLPMPAGTVGTRSGAVLSAADSMRITVHGRGAHGSMPQASVDPVVLAAMIVIRLQTIVAREVAPTDPAVVTVGSIRAGSKSNIIDDHAVLELNVRTYDDATRNTILEAIRRIVVAECEASGSPQEPQFELFDRFPPTVNDPAVTRRLDTAFADHFGPHAIELPLQSASEDFSDLPLALTAPYSYWGIGGVDPHAYARAADAGRVAQDIPVNHSPAFAPVLQPTLDTGTQAMTIAALTGLT